MELRPGARVRRSIRVAESAACEASLSEVGTNGDVGSGRRDLSDRALRPDIG
jgi:hypothetical protein